MGRAVDIACWYVDAGVRAGLGRHEPDCLCLRPWAVELRQLDPDTGADAVRRGRRRPVRAPAHPAMDPMGPARPGPGYRSAGRPGPAAALAPVGHRPASRRRDGV